MSGRGDWIRTNDLVVPNDALYQAELHPVLSLDYRLNRPGVDFIRARLGAIKLAAH